MEHFGSIYLYYTILYNNQLYKKVHRIQHTKELSENAREEVQVARDIISHNGWERFHHSVDAKNSLNKLQIQK